MREDTLDCGLRLQVRTQGSACGQVREDQEANFRPVMPGDNDVLRDGGERRNSAHSQLAHVNPRSRRQFEILGHTSIEYEPALRNAFVHESHRIANPIETLFIEVQRREFGPAPIARSNQSSAHAHFVPVAVRQELELAARYWESN